MRATGYGADLELTEGALVIHAGKVSAKIQASPTVTIPLADVVGLDWKDASRLVNGRVRVFVADSVDLSSYGPRPNAINPQSLVVHWRRRDRDAFAALREQLDELFRGRPAEPSRREPSDHVVAAKSEPSVESAARATEAQAGIEPTDFERSLRELAKRTKHGSLTLKAFELWDSRSSVEVAGESFHRAELAALYKPKDRRSGEEFWTEAALVPEVNNAHDPNAIRVDVEGQTVGYLAREDAVRYRTVLARLVTEGYGALVKARVWATHDDGTWRGRVTLQLGEPGSIVPSNAHPGELAAELPEGRSIQVTGEEAHRDVLGPLLAVDRKVALWCTLHALTVKTARSEKRVAEVRVDGRPAGTLAPTASADLLTVVDRAETVGRSVVAHGFLSGNSLTVVLTLSVPRAVDLTEEWISEYLAPAVQEPGAG